jgi:hypothetical protein
MPHIDRDKYTNLINQLTIGLNACKSDITILSDCDKILAQLKNLVSDNNIKFTATWLLEKDLWLQCEKQEIELDKEILSRGRIVVVNPGVSNIGREQRYVHYYIVLGEYEETFIGVPITNMAFNDETKQFYLRNIFEIELINPSYKKPFSEFRVNKPSVADIRNIAGLDKRRIHRNQLYREKKYVPNCYLNTISEKIRNTLAIMV